MKKSFLLFVVSAAACSFAGWRDPAPCGPESLVVGDLRVDPVAENLFRVRMSRGGAWTESGLNRYGILRKDWPKVASDKGPGSLTTASAEVSVADGAVRIRSRVSAADLSVAVRADGKGFELRFPLAEGERVYGLGDVSRENIQRRPGRYEIWVKNVNSYIPMPMALTSRGWGLLVNTTWRNVFDVGQSDRDALVCSAPEGEVDFYVFVGRDYRALLDVYTRLTGRPQLLPVFGYGFTYVTNENVDMFKLLDEAREFRDRDLPCDVLGLEPGWMEKFYDRTTMKEWSKERFKFPYFAPKGGHTFVGALQRMGFKLSLWLCCGYDLFRYEEQCAAGEARRLGRQPDLPSDVSETWQDDRITGEVKDPRIVGETSRTMLEKLGAKESQFKEGDLPWFEHLKKFVDQGAQCFKLDGCNQFGEHPTRKWANGMSDEEMHNLYADVYDKQMARGFEDYTGRRSMVYSAGGYAGVQQFVATWAGDTGGGAKPLASLLNLGISGHSNQSCDMSIRNVESLHFGFLQTWSQQNNWDYWEQPWIDPPEKVAVFRAYAHLRYRLLPYIYTAAAEAARTGWPVMRALPFVYPDVPEYDTCVTTYMFGPDLLVSAFTKEISIPEGTWYDWRTGEEVKGPCKRAVKVSPDWGGALYVRAGAVIPMWPKRPYADKGWNEEVELHVWPGPDGTSWLYEDDGTSLDYRAGKGARTSLVLKGNELTVGRREGAFKGMPATRRMKIVTHRSGSAETVEVDLGEVGAAGWAHTR